MTEEEWLEATDPLPMLEFVRGAASQRKLQVLACGCARSIWSVMRSGDRERIQIVEAEIEGVEGMPRRISSRVARHSGDPTRRINFPSLTAGPTLGDRVVRAVGQFADVYVTPPVIPGTQATGHEMRSRERAVQADLMRCVFGNPFHPVAVNPSWRTSTAVAVAQGIYDDKAFDRLPILADALQDAGCENADLLSHLRSDGPHVRGCWALDLALGKE